MTTDEQLVTANGVQLCVQTFGSPDDEAVLLVADSMLSWPDELCERLADGGRLVVRYDARDTGRSVSYGLGKATYSLRDLVDDAAGVLDALDVGRAHVVGLSAGAWTAQLLALDHPDRVRTLTLIAARSVAPGPVDDDLPDHDPRFMQVMMSTPEPDWSDRAAAIDHLVASDRLYAGAGVFDEAASRAIALRVVDRTTDLAASLTNIAFIDHGDRWRERLPEVAVPTLVLHGTEDPFFPFGNGEAVAAEIPGARLQPLPGVGHGLPPSVVATVAAAVLDHSA